MSVTGLVTGVADSASGEGRGRGVGEWTADGGQSSVVWFLSGSMSSGGSEYKTAGTHSATRPLSSPLESSSLSVSLGGRLVSMSDGTGRTGVLGTGFSSEQWMLWHGSPSTLRSNLVNPPSNVVWNIGWEHSCRVLVWSIRVKYYIGI